MIRIKSDKLIVGDKTEKGYLYIDGGKIAEVTDKVLPSDKEYDFTGNYVSAGFIDLHTHGAGENGARRGAAFRPDVQRG